MNEMLKSTHSTIMSADEYLGGIVKQYREKNKVKQEQLAKYLGISTMGLSYLENGKRSWKLKDAIKAGNVLGFVLEIKNAPLPAIVRDQNEDGSVRFIETYNPLL